MTLALLREAEQRLRKGDTEAARELARRSDRIEAQMFLAMLESSQKRLDAALAHLRRYLESRPGDANAWYNVGMLELQEQRPKPACSAFESALSAQPVHVPALVGLAQVRSGQGDSQTALDLLRRAWRHDPGQPVVADALSRLLPAQEAIEVLERAVERHPANPSVWARLGQLQLAIGRAEEALDSWKRAAKGGADAVACLVGQARAMIDLGRAEEAVAVLEPALAEKPQAALHDAMAVALSAAQRGKSAIEHARAAVKSAPDHPRYAFNLASLLSQTTDPALLREARKICENLIESGREDAATYHCLAIVAGKLGQHDDALSHAAEAVKRDPVLRHYLTFADLQAHSDPASALSTLDIAMKRHGASAEPLRQRGIARLKLREPEQALEDLERAITLDPGDQRSIAHRAVALAALDRSSEAAEYSGLSRWILARLPPVPDGFRDMTSFNQQLADDIRNHSLMRWEPLGLAARNGGLTDDLTADSTPAIRGFEQLLRNAIDDLCSQLQQRDDDPFLRAVPRPGHYALNIWATLVRDGGLIDTHIHEDSWLSGAYYVTLPEVDENTGAIEFGRPHADLPQAQAAPVRRILPETGLLLMFPSFLFHRTLPFRSQSDRISISFDVTPT